MFANGLPGLKNLAYPDCGDEEDVAEAVAKVLKLGLNKTWKRLTFSDAWDIQAIAKQVKKAISEEGLSYEVDIEEEKETQTLVFEDLRIPPLTAAPKKYTLRFRKGFSVGEFWNTLNFDEALTTWFKNNKNNIRALEEFTEALAEQPQIQCVDFTDLTDKDVHKLYGTIEEWNRLLNVPGTVFKFVSARPKTDDKAVVASYENLKVRNDVAWYLDSGNGEVRLFKDDSMCMKPTKDKIAVTKDKRLLWNRTALDCLFQKGQLSNIVKDKSKDIDVKIVDFTIGDPNVKWIASDGRTTRTWEDVWKYAGSKSFVNDVKGFEIVRVYEDYLGKDNQIYLKKNSEDFKYIGKRNGKQMVEITFDTEDDTFSTSTANETEDNEKHFEEDEEEDEREEMEMEMDPD